VIEVKLLKPFPVKGRGFAVPYGRADQAKVASREVARVNGGRRIFRTGHGFEFVLFKTGMGKPRIGIWTRLSQWLIQQLSEIVLQ
jgi:hypothetical protein